MDEKHIKKSRHLFWIPMALCMVLVSASSVFAWQWPWDTPRSGEGTAEDPYLIESPADLYAMKGAVEYNHGRNTNKRAHFLQTADIDMEGDIWYGIDGFEGVYDGGGYEITNMRYDTDSESQYCGFFTSLRGATVMNLGIAGVEMCDAVELDPYRAMFTGGLCATSTVGTSIINCYVKQADLIAGKCGGLLGRMSETDIVSSYVINSNICGYKVAGGLVGDAGVRSSIAGSYATAGIDVFSGFGANLANISAHDVTISGCASYNSSRWDGRKAVGFLEDVDPDYERIDCETLELESMKTKLAWKLNWELYDNAEKYLIENNLSEHLRGWEQCDAQDGLPKLNFDNKEKTLWNGYGNGTEEFPWLVGNAEELYKAFRKMDKTVDGREGYYRQTSDIDLKGVSWIPAREFRGTYDGGGHSISNLGIKNLNDNEYDRVGLFGTLQKATVFDLGLKNCYLQNGEYDIGALAGNAQNSLIYNCYVGGIETEGKADGFYTGSLIGYCLNSNVIACYAKSDTPITGSSVGGLIGGIDGFDGGNSLLIACYSAVPISSERGDVDRGAMFGFVSKRAELTGCFALESKDYQSAEAGSPLNDVIFAFPEETMKSGTLTRGLNDTFEVTQETLCNLKIQDKVRIYKNGSDYPVFE